jgi:hypothetical protein
MGSFATSRLQRKLAKITDEINRLRAEEIVLREQTLAFEEEEDYNSVKSVVSDDRFAQRESLEATKDANAFRSSLLRTQTRLGSLMADRDKLLDKLAEELR